METLKTVKVVLDEAGMEKLVVDQLKKDQMAILKEIVVNSLDSFANSPTNTHNTDNKITITISDNSITFEDNGPGMLPEFFSENSDNGFRNMGYDFHKNAAEGTIGGFGMGRFSLFAPIAHKIYGSVKYDGWVEIISSSKNENDKIETTRVEWRKINEFTPHAVQDDLAVTGTKIILHFNDGVKSDLLEMHSVVTYLDNVLYDPKVEILVKNPKVSMHVNGAKVESPVTTSCVFEVDNRNRWIPEIPNDRVKIHAEFESGTSFEKTSNFIIRDSIGLFFNGVRVCSLTQYDVPFSGILNLTSASINGNVLNSYTLLEPQRNSVKLDKKELLKIYAKDALLPVLKTMQKSTRLNSQVENFLHESGLCDSEPLDALALEFAEVLSFDGVSLRELLDLERCGESNGDRRKLVYTDVYSHISDEDSANYRIVKLDGEGIKIAKALGIRFLEDVRKEDMPITRIYAPRLGSVENKMVEYAAGYFSNSLIPSLFYGKYMLNDKLDVEMRNFATFALNKLALIPVFSSAREEFDKQKIKAESQYVTLATVNEIKANVDIVQSSVDIRATYEINFGMFEYQGNKNDKVVALSILQNILFNSSSNVIGSIILRSALSEVEPIVVHEFAHVISNTIHTESHGEVWGTAYTNLLMLLKRSENMTESEREEIKSRMRTIRLTHDPDDL